MLIKHWTLYVRFQCFGILFKILRFFFFFGQEKLYKNRSVLIICKIPGIVWNNAKILSLLYGGDSWLNILWNNGKNVIRNLSLVSSWPLTRQYWNTFKPGDVRGTGYSFRLIRIEKLYLLWLIVDIRMTSALWWRVVRVTHVRPIVEVTSHTCWTHQNYWQEYCLSCKLHLQIIYFLWQPSQSLILGLAHNQFWSHWCSYFGYRALELQAESNSQPFDQKSDALLIELYCVAPYIYRLKAHFWEIPRICVVKMTFFV